MIRKENPILQRFLRQWLLHCRALVALNVHGMADGIFQQWVDECRTWRHRRSAMRRWHWARRKDGACGATSDQWPELISDHHDIWPFDPCVRRRFDKALAFCSRHRLPKKVNFATSLEVWQISGPIPWIYCVTCGNTQHVCRNVEWFAHVSLDQNHHQHLDIHSWIPIRCPSNHFKVAGYYPFWPCCLQRFPCLMSYHGSFRCQQRGMSYGHRLEVNPIWIWLKIIWLQKKAGT